MKVSLPFKTLQWVGGTDGFLRIIDQTALPDEEVYLDLRTVDELFDAIKRLSIRGAPAIGVAAAYGLVIALKDAGGDTKELKGKVKETARRLKSVRPTAVNLFHGINTVQEEVFSLSDETDPAEFKKVVLSAAMRLQAEDEEMCEKLGSLGAELIEDNSTVLTNCNAGALATCGIGTALACVYTAASQDKRIHVVCCETRPLLQGARLSTWELKKAGILTTLICDNMAGTLMRTGRISAIFVGADRIAANGDVANKIGTYPLAVLANAHSVPFYVVAPSSSFDLNISSGEEIPIEERSASEIIFVRGKVRIAPDGISVYNPAFDVTPSNLITAIIWEGGILKPPYRPEEIKKAISKGSNCADKENPLHHRYKQF